MSLEAQRVADVIDMDQNNRRAKSERRGKDRRKAGTRVNKAAPRRSLIQLWGAWATAMSFAILALVVIASAVLLTETPWLALAVAGTAVVTSLFALMLGSLEQRLIEIRLEVMMTNGGMREADRRGGNRREVDVLEPSAPAFVKAGQKA